MEYGLKAAEAEAETKAGAEAGDGSQLFQSLLFLIRDWKSPSDHSYVIEGGRQLIGKRLKVCITVLSNS